jgi:hypothetical protein
MCLPYRTIRWVIILGGVVTHKHVTYESAGSLGTQNRRHSIQSLEYPPSLLRSQALNMPFNYSEGIIEILPVEIWNLIIDL